MVERNRKAPSGHHIFLIGFMGSGKSTVAACLSKQYHMEQVEMDARIEQEEGRKISEIFAQDGEEYFRSLETELLRRLQDRGSLVVSCGGGVAVRECNVREMKGQGKVIWLKASPETIFERVRTSHDRPLLEGNMNIEYISGLMKKRNPKYEAAADFSIDTDGKGAEEIAREIMEKISQPLS